MKVSLGLPTHRVDLGNELAGGGAVTELARAAEDGGFSAVFVTEHPFPGGEWLASGGHSALDPFVALAFAAAATSTLRLHTHLLIPAYRNPFLAAKAVSSLDVLSEGRVVLGVGAGYLEPEFVALGVDPAERNELLDEALVAMKAAWTGEPVTSTGRGWRADGNVMLPTPAQRPHPPIWVGGNTRRAVRRAVEHADGWAPIPARRGFAGHIGTAAIPDTETLAARVAEAQALAAEAGRPPLTVVYSPPSMLMTGSGKPVPEASALVDEAHELAAAGVDWLTVTLPGETRRELLSATESYAADVLAAIAEPREENA